MFYYRRRLSKGLYSSGETSFINTSLHTKSRSKAIKLAGAISVELESYWASQRLSNILGKHILTSPPQVEIETASNQTIEAPTFAKAKELYLRLKGTDKGEYFFVYTERNAKYFVEAVGDKPITEYTKLDGGKYRDSLIARGLTMSSVRRIYTTSRAILNVAISEYGLGINNPLANIYFPEANDSKKRVSTTPRDLALVERLCKETNDEKRWIIALISLTGIRLSEAVGIQHRDFVLDTPTPYIHIRPNKIRRLKTKGSERMVPLVGLSLWAAHQINPDNSKRYAFTHYAKNGKCFSDSASAALNKWLKTHINKKISVHSFRHGLRTEMRNSNFPVELCDQIGGWAPDSVGGRYGEHMDMELKHEHMTCPLWMPQKTLFVCGARAWCVCGHRRLLN